jgi:hypothetical protein
LKLQEAQDVISKLSEKLEQASAAKREQGEFDWNFAHDPDCFFVFFQDENVERPRFSRRSQIVVEQYSLVSNASNPYDFYTDLDTQILILTLSGSGSYSFSAIVE